MNKKLLYTLGGICFIAVALFGGKVWYEGQIRNKIEATLASLPAPLTAKAERIDVSALEKSVTLTNLVCEYTDESGKLTYSIASLAARGINFDAFKDGVGTTKLADSVLLRDLRVTSPFITASIASHTVSDIRGDYAQIKKATLAVLPELAQAYTSPVFAAERIHFENTFSQLGSLLKAYETLYIGNAVTEKYAYTMAVAQKTVSGIVERATVASYSMQKMGVAAIENITLSIDNAPLAHFDSITMDEATLPSLVNFFAEFEKRTTPSPTMVYEVLGGQPFLIKNLRLKGIHFFEPTDGGEQLFTLDTASFTYDAADSHNMDFVYSGLTVNKKSLVQAELPEEILTRFGDAVTFEGGTTLRMTPQKNDTFTLEYQTRIHSSPLGSTSLSVDITNVTMDTVSQIPHGPIALKGVTLTVTDKGASDILLIVKAKNENKTPEEARADIIAELLSGGESLPNETLKDLVTTVATFIENSGQSLHLELAPVEPLRFAEVQAAIVMEPEKLGITATVAPAQ